MEENEKKKISFWTILYYIVYVLLWIIYILVEFICTTIEVIASIFLGVSIIKSTRKRKKRWFF